MELNDERSVVSTLTARYPIFAPSTIERWVSQETENYATAKIRTFVPILVQRAVEATLRELARTEGVTANSLPLDHSDRHISVDLAVAVGNISSVATA